MMNTVRDALLMGGSLLKEKGLETPGLDAQLLLADVLGVERHVLLTNPDQQLDVGQDQRYRHLLERRQRHEPVAYLLGKKHFYGLDIQVTPAVLIPRPETELLVEEALHYIKQRCDRGEQPVVADIGTGSGVIPVTLAVNEPRLQTLYGCDISDKALEVAASNVERYSVGDRVHLIQGDLLASLPEPVDILIANLPYVGREEEGAMSPEVLLYEPELALFSGPDGLGLLKRFCMEISQSGRLNKDAVILLEVGYQQCTEVMSWLLDSFPQARTHCIQDFAGWERHLIAEL